MGHEKEIRVLDLFSGIGGFSLGFRRAGGFRTVAYCEIEPYCQEVLRARMLDGSLDTAPICRDIRVLDGRALTGVVDLVCGGFPCQDISAAGLKAGIDGGRSRLWLDMGRIIREIRPRFVFVENVAALLARGLERVLGDLAAIGYDAEWECIPASAVGAHHVRDRVWIVAYPKGFRSELRSAAAGRAGRPSGGGNALADAKCQRCEEMERLQRGGAAGKRQPSARRECGVFCGRVSGRWEPEPNVGRVAHGVPHRVERLSALGNAVVPQVVEWIGRRIIEIA